MASGRGWLVGVGALGLFGAGCSASSASAAPSDGGPSDTAIAAEGAAACTPSSSCGTGSGVGQCVTTVDATLFDPSGKPVAGVPVFTCGTNLCTEPHPTAADGHAQVAACLDIAAPALKVFNDPAWVPFAALLEGAGPSYTLAHVTLAPLPASGTPLAKGHNASAGVSLDVTGTVTFDLEHMSAASRGFRAASVTPGWYASTGLDPATLHIEVVWGLAPLNTKLSPAATLTVPNSAGWTAGAQVDVFLNGTDTSTSTPPAPWGTWGPIGTAHVSADGKTVATDPGAGNGLPEVAMVGLKLH